MNGEIDVKCFRIYSPQMFSSHRKSLQLFTNVKMYLLQLTLALLFVLLLSCASSECLKGLWKHQREKIFHKLTSTKSSNSNVENIRKDDVKDIVPKARKVIPEKGTDVTEMVPVGTEMSKAFHILVGLVTKKRNGTLQTKENYLTNEIAKAIDEDSTRRGVSILLQQPRSCYQCLLPRLIFMPKHFSKADIHAKTFEFDAQNAETKPAIVL